MNNSKEKLRLIVSESRLSEKQKIIWGGFLENIDDELAAPLVETVQNDETMLQLLTKNIEDKIQALSSENPEEWDKLRQEEKTVLDNINE